MKNEVEIKNRVIFSMPDAFYCGENYAKVLITMVVVLSLSMYFFFPSQSVAVCFPGIFILADSVGAHTNFAKFPD